MGNITRIFKNDTGQSTSPNDAQMNKIDSELPLHLLDFDQKIKNFQVLSQYDYNINKPDNETLYFINNIEEVELGVGNIVDIAMSNIKDEKGNEKKEMWILEADEEVEEVILWRENPDDHTFIKVKTYPGFVDGRLTFDGVFEYNKDFSAAVLITNAEPFIVLISAIGELYAFPSLKYKIKPNDDLDAKNKAMLIDGDEYHRVKACSVEKGYCTELFKEYDQGIVVAYSIESLSGCELRYRQFRFDEMSLTSRRWSSTNVICSKNSNIFNIALRRLADYRLCITYNFWGLDENNEQVSCTEFRYSERTYAGLAYKPEVINIKGAPKLGSILYACVRNDNKNRIELPYLAMIGEPQSHTQKKGLTYKYNVDIFLGLDADGRETVDNPIPLQLIIEQENEDEFSQTYIRQDNNEEIPYGEMLGFDFISTWPYGDYETDTDPEYGSSHAMPIIESVTNVGDKIKIRLQGQQLPLVPFYIVPTSNFDSSIKLRYNVEPFNNNGEGNNLAGWFALTDFRPTLLGSVKTRSVGAESHNFKDYTKQIFKSKQIKITQISRQTLTGSGQVSFGLSGQCSCEIVTPEVVERSITDVELINIAGGCFAECGRVSIIDV